MPMLSWLSISSFYISSFGYFLKLLANQGAFHLVDLGKISGRTRVFNLRLIDVAKGMGSSN